MSMSFFIGLDLDESSNIQFRVQRRGKSNRKCVFVSSFMISTGVPLTPRAGWTNSNFSRGAAALRLRTDLQAQWSIEHESTEADLGNVSQSLVIPKPESAPCVAPEPEATSSLGDEKSITASCEQLQLVHRSLAETDSVFNSQRLATSGHRRRHGRRVFMLSISEFSVAFLKLTFRIGWLAVLEDALKEKNMYWVRIPKGRTPNRHALCETAFREKFPTTCDGRSRMGCSDVAWEGGGHPAAWSASDKRAFTSLFIPGNEDEMKALYQLGAVKEAKNVRCECLHAQAPSDAIAGARCWLPSIRSSPLVPPPSQVCERCLEKAIAARAANFLNTEIIKLALHLKEDPQGPERWSLQRAAAMLPAGGQWDASTSVVKHKKEAAAMQENLQRQGILNPRVLLSRLSGAFLRVQCAVRSLGSL